MVSCILFFIHNYPCKRYQRAWQQLSGIIDRLGHTVQVYMACLLQILIPDRRLASALYAQGCWQAIIADVCNCPPTCCGDNPIPISNEGVRVHIA